jgi:hypothetical protein
MGIRLLNKWDKPKEMVKVEEISASICVVLLFGVKVLKQSITVGFTISSKVGLIASIFSKVCSTL